MDHKIKSYIVVTYPEGEMEQQSIAFNPEEYDRAVTMYKQTKEWKGRADLIAVLDLD